MKNMKSHVTLGANWSTSKQRQARQEKLRKEAIEHIQRPVRWGEVLGEVGEWFALAVYPGLIIWAWMSRW